MIYSVTQNPDLRLSELGELNDAYRRIRAARSSDNIATTMPVVMTPTQQGQLRDLIQCTRAASATGFPLGEYIFVTLSLSLPFSVFPTQTSPTSLCLFLKANDEPLIDIDEEESDWIDLIKTTEEMVAFSRNSGRASLGKWD